MALHEKTKGHDWEFTFTEQNPKFPSKITMPKKGKDPFRFQVRDYVKGESEKDERTHGFLEGCCSIPRTDPVDCCPSPKMRMTASR